MSEPESIASVDKGKTPDNSAKNKASIAPKTKGMINAMVNNYALWSNTIKTMLRKHILRNESHEW